MYLRTQSTHCINNWLILFCVFVINEQLITVYVLYIRTINLLYDIGSLSCVGTYLHTLHILYSTYNDFLYMYMYIASAKNITEQLL